MSTVKVVTLVILGLYLFAGVVFLILATKSYPGGIRAYRQYLLEEGYIKTSGGIIFVYFLFLLTWPLLFEKE